MDPLSVTAGVIAILQLTGKVIQYLNDVRDAPKECQQCTIEASNLQSLLMSLRYLLEQGHTNDPWFTAVRALTVANGPLDQYKQTLEQLCSRVEIQNTTKMVKRQVLWKFIKAEVASILSRLERLKSLVSISLEMDHFKLSEAIKEDTKVMRNAIPFLQADIVTIRDTQSLQWDAQKLQQRQTMLDWLSPTDFPAQQHDIISRRQEDTGQWFIDSPEFQEWSQGANRTLFCPGIPGAGKTMMTAIAIDHLCRTVQSDNVEIAYLFCSYKAKADQSVFNLLTALLKQLVQSQPDMATPVTRMYDYHTKKKSRPSLSDIFEALQSVCSNQTTVYILVDALDECADTDGGRGRLIDKLCELQTKGDLRLMLTSRFIPEVTERFRSSPSLEVRASDSDVRHFIDGHIPRLPKCIQRNEELQNLVQDKIAGAVDGMFLLARLHVDSLLDKRNKQSVMSTLEKLTKGSAALEKAYGEAIKRIDGQLDNDRSLARCALSWITYAQRPLTTRELCHALAIEPDDKTLNNDSVDDVEDVISVCAGLVTVDEESNVIRLVHYTTQEYFERIRLEWNPSAQEAITVACLTYLSFDAFRSGSCANDRAFAEKLTENAFYDYSARYWSEHIRPVEKTTSSLALAFLCDEALVDAAIQAVSMSNYKYEGYSTRFPNQTTGMHLAARYGLLYLTEKLLVGKCGDIGIEADSKDSFGRTSLSWAAARGHEAVVRLLVERDDVEADSTNKYGQTPLSIAAENGHEAVVRLLVERDDVEADPTDKDGRTPLSMAAARGHEAVVRLLVERDDVEADSRDEDGQTPLSLAAENGYEAVVRLLVERDDVEADSRDEDGRTPLSMAAENGHEAVVRLLVERDDVEADSRDEDGRTPLWWAAARGHEAVVWLLVEWDDVEADSRDKYGRMPLSIAAASGQEAVVRLLVERDDVEADSTNKYGQTPLSMAAENGHEAVVRLLVERDDVEADSTDKDGQTPLSMAAARGHGAVVRLLVERDDVEADSRDNYSRTPLTWASRMGHTLAMEILLARKDVDPNSKDLFGRAPLSAAAVNGYEGAVALLLTKKSIEPGSQDMFGRTPLSDAVKRGYLPIVELLLQRLKGQGNPVTKQELPAVRRPTVDPKCRIFCSICLAPIPDFDSHHHCGICDHGDFDMCEDCLASGAVCTDLSHTLAKRTVREGVLVNVTN